MAPTGILFYIDFTWLTSFSAEMLWHGILQFLLALCIGIRMYIRSTVFLELYGFYSDGLLCSEKINVFSNVFFFAYSPF